MAGSVRWNTKGGALTFFNELLNYMCVMNWIMRVLRTFSYIFLCSYYLFVHVFGDLPKLLELLKKRLLRLKKLLRLSIKGSKSC